MTTHVALSHTPFHLLQLGIIAERAAGLGEQTLIFHEGSFGEDIPGLSHATVVVLPGFAGYRSGRLQARRNIRAIMRHPVWAERDVVLYASDLKWLTNNAVYFAQPRRGRKDRTVLITDGLGSYLKRDDWVKTRLTAAVKAVLGFAGYGPSHRPLRGHHFGLDTRYAAAAIGFNAELILGDLPKRSLMPPPASNPGFIPVEPSLILGAPLDDHRFTREAARNIVEALAQAALALTPDGSPLWYKPHHFEQPWIAESYQALGFAPIDDVRPAELIIKELGVRRVFGNYSSALAFGPQYASGRCQAFSVAFESFAEGYLNEGDREKLRVLLLQFGVQFL